ncbi:kinetochore protein NDC80 homolog isoform X2 [Patella vulgata]|nr:kinetochore protein NDC80 homolog isoform X2 [Patella vulgata]XP_055954815.1 kinetochore protein NDC80 homolog isoform X2 [Patella vulgata]XP_055954816.1 kinetochore protein NDC80 homolog isoform X2 [Patella vulgata]
MRKSVGPLRVRNEDPNQQTRGGKRSSSGSNVRSSSGSRLSVNNRQSTGRVSTGGRQSGIPTMHVHRPSTGRPSVGRPSYGGQGTGASHKFGSNTKNIGIPSYGQLNKRHSSIGGRGRTTVPKECRPISDKSYQQRSIRKLCEFLVENGYPCSISHKVLQSPPNKEYYKMFEFIYSFLVPGIKITKPDEEIPRIFKLLGYPVTITKSAMYTVGSLHTWPGLLAALIWLQELVISIQELESGDDNYLFTPDDDFDSVPEDKMLYLYVEKTYKAYLSGEDEFDSYDHALSQAIKAKYCGGSSSGDPLADINRLQQELELLEQDSDLLPKLKEQKAVIESDVHRFTDYLNKLESHTKTQLHQLKEEDEEVSSLNVKLESLSQKYENMQVICENQALTQADIQRINQMRKDLQNQIDCREKEKESLDKEMWKIETDVAKSREKIEGISREYNSLAHTLKLIPSTAENAQGLDYEMKTSHQSTMKDDMENMKVSLTQFKKKCSAAVRQKETEKLNQQSTLEMIRETKNEAIEENNAIEKKLKQKEEELDGLKKMNHREIQMIQEEIESEQNIILELQKLSLLGNQEALKDLRETQKNCEERYVALDKMERFAINNLNELVENIVQHKTNQQFQLENYTELSREILKKLENDYKDIC